VNDLPECVVYRLRNMTYEQRLEVLEITTLKERRRRGDLIKAFKILKNIH